MLKLDQRHLCSLKIFARLFSSLWALFVLPAAAIAAGYNPALDRGVFQTSPKVAEQIALSFVPGTASPLLGRNKAWGGVFSARFQAGAGFALRMSLLAKRPDIAKRAYAAIEAGAETISADGRVISKLPTNVGKGRSLTPSDQASAAAFYLGDACLGQLALETSPESERVAEYQRQSALKEKLGKATVWLKSARALLMYSDRKAPNRLLFDALAFRACGELFADPPMLQFADQYVLAALRLVRADGSFVEGGGTDTSYQAVAVRVGFDLLIAGDQNDKLVEKLRSASNWLASHVAKSGELDSSNNTRTCGGGEEFLGQSKIVVIPEVFRALQLAALHFGDKQILKKAEMLSSYYAPANNQVRPCG